MVRKLIKPPQRLTSSPEFEEVSPDDILAVAMQPPVLIVVATEVERKAALRLMEPYKERLVKGPVDQKTYFVGTFGVHRTVLTTCRMGSSGRDGATSSILQALYNLQPDCVIMVGIAFGKSPETQQLGQVLVSSQVISYEQQRRGRELVHRGAIPEAHAALLDRFTTIDKWEFTLPNTEKCNFSIGPILSGDKLVDDPDFKKQLFSAFPQAIGGDMEGAGLCAAAANRGVPWILVKGICDWADGEKNDDYQELAASTAASLVHAVLSSPHALEGVSKRPSSEEDMLKSITSRFIPEIPRKFQDEETRILSVKLERAYQRRELIESEGQPSAAVIEEIKDIKRRLREGGQLRAGDILNGRYRLLDTLGSGGFAVVWRSQDLTNGERVAVKILRNKHSSNTVAQDRFFRGARHMRSIDHPAVVKIIREREEDERYFYYVMELVEGQNLEEAVFTDEVRKKDALPLILKVGSSLEEFHRKGLVHRDIKPRNILITRKGEPKLTDFDLILDDDSTGGTTGAIGTIRYAAPEALDNPDSMTTTADVWGLATTAVFIYHREQLPISVISDPVSVVNSLDCPNEIKMVLRRALRQNPAERYLNSSMFCNALKEARADWIQYIILRVLRILAIVALIVVPVVVFSFSNSCDSGMHTPNDSDASTQETEPTKTNEPRSEDGGFSVPDSRTQETASDARLTPITGPSNVTNEGLLPVESYPDFDKIDVLILPRGTSNLGQPTVAEIHAPRILTYTERQLHFLLVNNEGRPLEGEVTARPSTRDRGRNACVSDAGAEIACKVFSRTPFTIEDQESDQVTFNVSTRYNDRCDPAWETEFSVTVDNWRLDYRLRYELLPSASCAYRRVDNIRASEVKVKEGSQGE